MHQREFLYRQAKAFNRMQRIRLFLNVVPYLLAAGGLASLAIGLAATFL